MRCMSVWSSAHASACMLRGMHVWVLCYGQNKALRLLTYCSLPPRPLLTRALFHVCAYSREPTPFRFLLCRHPTRLPPHNLDSPHCIYACTSVLHLDSASNELPAPSHTTKMGKIGRPVPKFNFKPTSGAPLAGYAQYFRTHRPTFKFNCSTQRNEIIRSGNNK